MRNILGWQTLYSNILYSVHYTVHVHANWIGWPFAKIVHVLFTLFRFTSWMTEIFLPIMRNIFPVIGMADSVYTTLYNHVCFGLAAPFAKIVYVLYYLFYSDLRHRWRTFSIYFLPIIWLVITWYNHNCWLPCLLVVNFLSGTLKGQCDEIFETFLSKKLHQGPRQKRLREIFSFLLRYSQKCVSA